MSYSWSYMEMPLEYKIIIEDIKKKLSEDISKITLELTTKKMYYGDTDKPNTMFVNSIIFETYDLMKFLEKSGLACTEDKNNNCIYVETTQ